MSKKIAAVEAWWRKWNNRLMHPDDMSRASRTTMYTEVNEMVSVRNRTISMLITADPKSPHYAGMVEDAEKLIEEID